MELLRPGDGGPGARLEMRVQGWLGAANGVGAVTMFLYLGFTAPGSAGIHDPDAAALVVVFAGYMLLSMVFGGFVSRRIIRPTRRWMASARPAGPDEQRAVLDVPWRLAVMSVRFWLGAAVVFGLLSLAQGDPIRQVVRVASGVVLGGMAAATVAFLLVERVMRPTFADALAGGAPPPRRALGIRHRIVLSWALGSGVPLLAIAASPVGRRTGVGVTDLAVLAAIGFLAGGLMVTIATRSVSDRLAAVRRGLRQVERGDVDVEVAVDEGGEVGQLQAGFNEMARGLRERRRLEDLFGRHVGADVARHALERGIGLGGELRDVSVLFVDLVGSTTAAAVMAPTDVVAMLNDFFAVVVEAVSAEHGWVDKFEGDGALCVFGAPMDQPDHAARALRAARLTSRHPRLDLGIGVSSGRVVAGNIGTEVRHEYTVVGDPVNEAARLTEAAKQRPSRILASSGAVAAAGEEVSHWRDGPRLELRGRPHPTETFEPTDGYINDAVSG